MSSYPPQRIVYTNLFTQVNVTPQIKQKQNPMPKQKSMFKSKPKSDSSRETLIHKVNKPRRKSKPTDPPGFVNLGFTKTVCENERARARFTQPGTPVIPLRLPGFETGLPITPTALFDLFKTAKSIEQGKSVLKFFHKKTFDFDVSLIPSTCTYWGMLESLVKLHNELVWIGVDVTKICVLGPHYHDPKDDPNAFDLIRLDTQACGGGKAIKIYDNYTKSWKYEPYEIAAWNELIEEIRIAGMNGILVSNFQTETVNGSSSKGNIKKQTTYTQIYSYRACDCVVPTNYVSSDFCKKNRRGIDNYFARVGYIVWGSIDECFTLVNSIETDALTAPLVEHIDAVAIIPLSLAISMVDFAKCNLRGRVVSCQY